MKFLSFTMAQAAGLNWWGLERFIHSTAMKVVGIVLLCIVARALLRWFLGINAVLRNQRHHAQLLEHQNMLLQKQIRLLEGRR